MTGEAPTPIEEFVRWLQTEHHDAAVALHDGDAAPKLATWSSEEPVTLFGAFWFEAANSDEARTAFTGLAEKFSDCTAYSYDLIAYGVSGDMAYTVGHEHASMRVDGEPVDHLLRVTQVYRREHGAWKVVHRHADAARAADEYTVITLCGSMRFRDEFERLDAELTLAGRVVLTPTALGPSTELDAEERARLGRVHLQKVAMADEVLIVNVGDYVGESTRREIEHARSRGIPVRFLEPHASD